MPVNTGPDSNTYTIPEVQLGDTFNYWKDTTNISVYKLNKLRIYDAVDSGNIGSTYGTTGAWKATLLDTITTGHTFSSSVVFSGGLSAAYVYVGFGATVGGNLTVNGGSTLAGRLNVGGAAILGGGLTVSGNLFVSGGSTLAGRLDVSSLAVVNGATVAGNLTVSGGTTLSGRLDANTVAIVSGVTIGGNLTVSGGTTLAGRVDASSIAVANGATVGGNLTVSGGTTLSSTLSVSGAARFATGVCAGVFNTTTSGATFSGNLWLGDATSGTSVTSLYGSLRMRYQSPLWFFVSNNSNYVGFRAPASVASSDVVWTLPNADGSGGQVLTTNGSGTLSWKAADGVTGTNLQVQYNQAGSPGATSSFLFHYDNSAGYSAGTLGVSGGAYIMGNVGIGVTGQNIGRRIVHGTGTNTAQGKLEVVGDVRIPSGGFFVNSNITIPAGVCGSIGSTENAFLSGTLTIASGATLTVESGGTLVVL